MKKIVKLSQLIQDEFDGVQQEVNRDNIEKVKAEYPLSIEIIHSMDNTELISSAYELADELPNEVLVYEIDEGLGGGDDGIPWREMLQMWAVVIALSNAYTISQQIASLIKSWPRLLKLFKVASIKNDFYRTPEIRCKGPNESWVIFRFFYFFTDDEYLDGIKLIPTVFSEVKFNDKQDITMVYDGLQKRWFIESIIHNEN